MSAPPRLRAPRQGAPSRAIWRSAPRRPPPSAPHRGVPAHHERRAGEQLGLVHKQGPRGHRDRRLEVGAPELRHAPLHLVHGERALPTHAPALSPSAQRALCAEGLEAGVLDRVQPLEQGALAEQRLVPLVERVEGARQHHAGAGRVDRHRAAVELAELHALGGLCAARARRRQPAQEAPLPGRGVQRWLNPGLGRATHLQRAVALRWQSGPESLEAHPRRGLLSAAGHAAAAAPRPTLNGRSCSGSPHAPQRDAITSRLAVCPKPPQAAQRTHRRASSRWARRAGTAAYLVLLPSGPLVLGQVDGDVRPAVRGYRTNHALVRPSLRHRLHGSQQGRRQPRSGTARQSPRPTDTREHVHPRPTCFDPGIIGRQHGVS
eukprot:scaffold1928_cov381-Prasinococcus_capsulatus_cf.AAC.9